METNMQINKHTNKQEKPATLIYKDSQDTVEYKKERELKKKKKRAT